MKQKLEIDTPDGYEATGECQFRWWSDCDNEPYMLLRAPLRKSWVPPKWLPEGMWLFQSPYHAWFVANAEPVVSAEIPDRYWGQRDCTVVTARDLAALHNDTFQPPPVNKIRVRHAK